MGLPHAGHCLHGGAGTELVHRVLLSSLFIIFNLHTQRDRRDDAQNVHILLKKKEKEKKKHPKEKVEGKGSR